MQELDPADTGGCLGAGRGAGCHGDGAGDPGEYPAGGQYVGVGGCEEREGDSWPHYSSGKSPENEKINKIIQYVGVGGCEEREGDSWPHYSSGKSPENEKINKIIFCFFVWGKFVF